MILGAVCQELRAETRYAHIFFLCHNITPVLEPNAINYLLAMSLGFQHFRSLASVSSSVKGGLSPAEWASSFLVFIFCDALLLEYKKSWFNVISVKSEDALWRLVYKMAIWSFPKLSLVTPPICQTRHVLNISSVLNEAVLDNKSPGR